MMRRGKKFIVFVMKKTELLSSVSCRLVQITGKSKYPLHPKHLLDEVPWYFQFLNKRDRVLDIGCNNGQHTCKIATRVKSITGFDHDASMLRLARSLSKKKGLANVTFVQGNAEEKLPWGRASFTTVLLLDTIEHISRRRELLLEIHRILKRGGSFLLTAPNRETSWKRLQRSVGISSESDSGHLVEYTKDEVMQELSDAGFIIHWVRPIVYDTWLTGFIDLTGGISLSTYKQLGKWKRKKAIQHPDDSIGWRIFCKKRKVI